MKKKYFLLLIGIVFILKADIPTPEIASIASFNTLHLGYKGKDYAKIARVLKEFDIIGLQEVMNRYGMKQLRKALQKTTNEPWRYLVTRRGAGTTSYKEHYGYIWRHKVVKYVKVLGFYRENHPENFIREPYGVIFKAGNFDFTFVLCHLIFGKNKKARRAEAARILDVYNYFQSRNGREQDVIIAGDFNLPGNDSGFQNLKTHPDNIQYALPKLEKTSLGKKGQLSKSYDNFFYSKVHTEELLEAFVFHYPYFQRAPLYARKLISDHLPIYFYVSIKKDDD